MVELHFAAPKRAKEYEDWYEQHLGTLLAVPVFHEVHRFTAGAPPKSPFLAIYEDDSPAEFNILEYRTREGRGAPGMGVPLMVDWHRNVFDGLHPVPWACSHEVLILMDRHKSDDAPLPNTITVLRRGRLDRTVHERGLVVCSSGDALSARNAVAEGWPGTRFPLHPTERLTAIDRYHGSGHVAPSTRRQEKQCAIQVP